MAHFLHLPAKYQVVIGASVIGTLTIAIIGTVLMVMDLGKIRTLVEANSQAQTELIAKLSIDSLIAEDRPAVQTLVDGLKTTDSGLVAITVSNRDGDTLASWQNLKPGSEHDVIISTEKITHSGMGFGQITTSWSYSHFSAPIIKAKFRSVAITFAALAFLICVLGITLQYYLIQPLEYLEEKVRTVADPTAPKAGKRNFIARELRRLDESLDKTSTALAEKAQAEARMLSERSRAEEAEAAAQAKMDFLSLMSHEIRTPLGAMMGFGKLLESGNLDHEERELLSNLNRSGAFLLRVINDILDLSKIEANGIEFESVPVEPLQLLGDLENMISLLAEEKGLRLETHLVGLEGRRIRGDQHRLEQILMNLTGNAIKFTEEGQVDVRIEALDSTRDEELEQVRLRFAVSDTGIGMTAEQSQQIFEPFSQADSSVTRKFGGTGLGLSVSSRLVEGMGGELSVTSEPDRGSEFSFELVLPIEDASIESDLGSLTVERPREATKSNLKILIAEDEAVNRILIEKIFASFGHQIELVHDGLQCLERLEAGIDFDVLFVDLHMPHAGGLEIARRLRGGEFGQDGESVKLAMMSADVLAEREGREIGIDAFIPKPIDQPMLEQFLIELSRDCENAARAVPRMQALVVEDQPLNRELMVKLLTRHDVEVHTANDGIECLEFLQEQPNIDAILLDLRMPRMDGFSVARHIRDGKSPGYEGIPIAVVSAEVLEVGAMEGLDIAEFIPKPIDLGQIRNFVDGVRSQIHPVVLVS